MYAELLELARKVGLDAGALLMERPPAFEIESKSTAIDIATQMDKKAEKFIVESLLAARPDDGIIGEEGSAVESKSGITWVIDPLDGTTNFLHNIPQYCVSIALKQKEEITHAVVYDPNRNHLFTASKGQGAYLNDRRIRVSKSPKLQDSIIGTGIPFRDFTYLPQYLVILEEIVKKTAGIRRPGSAALDLAYVAAGWFDGFWEIDLSTWDVAAGGLIVSEAGGMVSDFDEKNNFRLSNINLATKISNGFIKDRFQTINFSDRFFLKQNAFSNIDDKIINILKKFWKNYFNMSGTYTQAFCLYVPYFLSADVVLCQPSNNSIPSFFCRTIIGSGETPTLSN